MTDDTIATFRVTQLLLGNDFNEAEAELVLGYIASGHDPELSDTRPTTSLNTNGCRCMDIYCLKCGCGLCPGCAGDPHIDDPRRRRVCAGFPQPLEENPDA